MVINLSMVNLIYSKGSYLLESKFSIFCFRYEGGDKRDLVIFQDTPVINHINGELSTRPFH